MTMKQLSEAADVDERTVGRIERGEVKNPSKADALQQVLQIGIYSTTEHPGGRPHDPRLSEASFTDLLGAIATKYGKDIRAAYTGGAGLDAVDELPYEIAVRARNGAIPVSKDQPIERNPEE